MLDQTMAFLLRECHHLHGYESRWIMKCMYIQCILKDNTFTREDRFSFNFSQLFHNLSG